MEEGFGGIQRSSQTHRRHPFRLGSPNFPLALGDRLDGFRIDVRVRIVNPAAAQRQLS
jgi:hypothetical protein